MSRYSERGENRGREATRVHYDTNDNTSLWDDSSNPVITYVPFATRITGSLTQEQLSAYQTMFRIQEITAKLRMNDLKPPLKRSRSPSPPPTYDPRGKRTNTREQRYKRKLEEERHRLVEIAIKMIPHYIAPEDYKRPLRFEDKYYIPVNEYPSINFVGLLLGPRGNTLKKLQAESRCKIAIRGRGSVKEGKNSNDLPKGAMDFSDPLHCLIIADSEEKLQKGIEVCQNIVIKAVTSPEGQNDLKRGQLRELAELNGTLREDSRPCSICGLTGHKKYDCPNRETFAQKVICRRCGLPGHVTRDCPTNNSTDAYGRFSNINDDHYSNNRMGNVLNGYEQRSRYSNTKAYTPMTYTNRTSRNSSPQQEVSTSSASATYNSSTLATAETTPPILSPPGTAISSDESTVPLVDTSSSTPSQLPSVPAGPPGISETESSIAPPTVSLELPPGLSSDSREQTGLSLPPGLSGPPGL